MNSDWAEAVLKLSLLCPGLLPWLQRPGAHKKPLWACGAIQRENMSVMLWLSPQPSYWRVRLSSSAPLTEGGISCRTFLQSSCLYWPLKADGLLRFQVWVLRFWKRSLWRVRLWLYCTVHTTVPPLYTHKHQHWLMSAHGKHIISLRRPANIVLRVYCCSYSYITPPSNGGCFTWMISRWHGLYWYLPPLSVDFAQIYRIALQNQVPFKDQVRKMQLCWTERYSRVECESKSQQQFTKCHRKLVVNSLREYLKRNKHALWPRLLKMIHIYLLFSKSHVSYPVDFYGRKHSVLPSVKTRFLPLSYF